jgi:hypothetical protein
VYRIGFICFGRAAQPAVPADRFAREIIGILAVCAVRLRRLNGNPFGVQGAWEADRL